MVPRGIEIGRSAPVTYTAWPVVNGPESRRFWYDHLVKARAKREANWLQSSAKLYAKLRFNILERISDWTRDHPQQTVHGPLTLP